MKSNEDDFERFLGILIAKFITQDKSDEMLEIMAHHLEDQLNSVRYLMNGEEENE